MKPNASASQTMNKKKPDCIHSPAFKKYELSVSGQSPFTPYLLFTAVQELVLALWAQAPSVQG